MKAQTMGPRETSISELPRASKNPFCYAAGKNVSKDECLTKTSVPRYNMDFCTANKCNSEWRVCLVCLLSGETKNGLGHDGAYFVKGSKLCKHHKDHGLIKRDNSPINLGEKVISLIYGDGKKPEIKEKELQDVRSPTKTTTLPFAFPPLPQADATFIDSNQPVDTASTDEKPITVPPPPAPAQPAIQATELKRDQKQSAGLAKIKEILRLEKLPEVKEVPTKRIRKFINQPRQFFNPEDELEMGRSIEEIGQQKMITVKPIVGDPDYDYELIDGETRWRGCDLSGKPTVLVEIRHVEDENAQHLMSSVLNFGQKLPSHVEIGLSFKRIFADYPNVKEIDLATIFCRSQTWVSQHRIIADLPEEVLRLMHPSTPETKRISFSVGLFLTRYPNQQLQEKAAVEISDKGMQLYAARAFIKKMAKQEGIELSRRKHKPSYDLRNLKNFLRRTQETGQNFLDMSEELKQMFEHRDDPYADKYDIREEIDAIVGMMQKLKQLI